MQFHKSKIVAHGDIPEIELGNYSFDVCPDSLENLYSEIWYIEAFSRAVVHLSY